MYNIFQFKRLNYNISIKIKIILIETDLIIPAPKFQIRIGYTNINIA